MTESAATSSPNPRILRAVQKQEITGCDLAPVDTSNTNIPSTDALPDLPNRKKRTGPIRAGKRKLSYQLRYLYKALQIWKSERGSYRIAFATVHFNPATEGKLAKARKGPVSAYADRLSKAFSALDNETNFFFTLEKGKSATKRLHAHILIAYHPDDFDKLTTILKKGANTTGTGLKIQHSYHLRHPARPGSFEYEALELDEEHGVCSYNKDDDGNYVRELPIDAGSADYMSKDLAKRAVVTSGHPYYAPRSLTQAANQLWDRAFAKQKTQKAL